MSYPKEREIRQFEGHRARKHAEDLTGACYHLFEAGATEEEVDTILGYRVVPTNPDLEWAQKELTWLATHFDDPNGR